MSSTAPLQKSPYLKNGWFMLILQKKPARLKNWMVSRNSSLQIKWHDTLKNRRSCVLKKIYCLYKNLRLQVDPLNSSCSQKLHYPEREISPLLFGEICCSKSHSCKCKHLQFLFYFIKWIAAITVVKFQINAFTN